MRSGFTYKAPFLIAASLLVAALAAAAVDAYTLKRTAKVGNASKSKVKIDFDYQGSPISVTMDVESKVTDVKDDGTITESSAQKNLSAMMGGTEVQHQDDAGSSTITRDKRGLAQTIESKDADDTKWRNERVINLIYPDKPVNVGDKWTYEDKADKAKDKPAAKVSYEVKGKEKVKDKDVLQIAFDFKETGVEDAIASSGTLWVSIATGEVLKAEGKIKNMPIPGVGNVDATWKQETVD